VQPRPDRCPTLLLLRYHRSPQWLARGPLRRAPRQCRTSSQDAREPAARLRRPHTNASSGSRSAAATSSAAESAPRFTAGPWQLRAAGSPRPLLAWPAVSAAWRRCASAAGSNSAMASRRRAGDRRSAGGRWHRESLRQHRALLRGERLVHYFRTPGLSLSSARCCAYTMHHGAMPQASHHNEHSQAGTLVYVY